MGDVMDQMDVLNAWDTEGKAHAVRRRRLTL
jgi:hypothetical protein